LKKSAEKASRKSHYKKNRNKKSPKETERAMNLHPHPKTGKMEKKAKGKKMTVKMMISMNNSRRKYEENCNRRTPKSLE